MPILTEQERLGTHVAGRYRVESLVGRGGTGVVFEASHGWTGRRVALKLLRPEHAGDFDRVRRFMQEARAAAEIDHPNVVQVLDMGHESDGTVYLVLELLRGRSLGALLASEGKLALEPCLRVLSPIMDALVTAHNKGIVHRDLKPDNIYLARSEAEAMGDEPVPKLLDFGMSKMVDAAWGSATQSGILVGTPYYMSPEQAEGRSDQGPACDVWSMGVILYRCLSGELPFTADSPTALLLAIVKERPPPLRERAPDVPQPIADVIECALTADREQRYPDIATMRAALMEAARRSGIAWPSSRSAVATGPHEAFDPGPALAPAAGSTARLWGGAALLLLIGATLLALLWRGRPAEPAPVWQGRPAEPAPVWQGRPAEPAPVPAPIVTEAAPLAAAPAPGAATAAADIVEPEAAEETSAESTPAEAQAPAAAPPREASPVPDRARPRARPRRRPSQRQRKPAAQQDTAKPIPGVTREW